MLKTILTIALVTFPVLIVPKEHHRKLSYTHHPVYLQILKNKPDIEHKNAIELTRIIINASEKYAIKSNLITAILMQESKYKTDATNKNCSGLFRKYVRKGTAIQIWDSKKRMHCVVTDYGISQIYITTVKSFNLDPNKLLNDRKYNIEAGVMVLADFKRMYGEEKDFWTRYNASNPEKRRTYKKLVAKWL